MVSQVEDLKESLARAEAKHGKDSRFATALKAQIAQHEKPRAANPVDHFSAGMRTQPAASRPAGGLPAAPLRADFETQEQLEEATGGWQGRVGRLRGMKGVTSR